MTTAGRALRPPVHLAEARLVADAVLYEGYLLYPYRASSGKNSARWQFGVLGPPGAADTGVGEAPAMALQALLDAPGDDAALVLHVRFLQLQRRQVLDAAGTEVARLDAGGSTWLSWDEAVEREVTLTATLGALREGVTAPVTAAGGEEREPVEGGVVVRRRWELDAELTARVVERPGGLLRLDIGVANRTALGVPSSKDEATRRSLLGAHLVVEAHDAAFVSLLEPPPHANAAAAACRQDRCWPVLAGRPGDTDVLLGLPIILYDYPEVAQESPGALFDATEIDEILMLRVLTMTEEEKAEARATDPLAREIVDRCEGLDSDLLQRLHGARRPTGGGEAGLDVPVFTDLRDAELPEVGTDAPWWDPAADASVDPDTDGVYVDGVRVARGSRVRIRPLRRADVHDLFYDGRVGRVTAVLADVDGGTHVALVLADDPGADLMEETGRFLYFDPDELEPLTNPDSDPFSDPFSDREEPHP